MVFIAVNLRAVNTLHARWCEPSQHVFIGAARWQAGAFQLGIVMSAAGVLVMLLTALKSFGAAELLGQVSQHRIFLFSLFCRPLDAVLTLLCHAK